MRNRGSVFVRRVQLAAPAAEVFGWHARPGAFERLTPPWARIAVLARSGGIRDGARVVLKVRMGPLARTWVLEHRDTVPGRRFADAQVRGPFSIWRHAHSFEEAGPSGSVLEDRIEYLLPAGLLGRVLAGRGVRRRLEKVFEYRHRVLVDDLERHRVRGGLPMKVLVSGSSGLVGSSLLPFLTTGGHSVVRLVRKSPAGDGEIPWDPARGALDPARLAGFDAIVHLAGESIAEGRWTAEKKTRIRESRVGGTRLLSEALAQLDRPPGVFVCASAMGYYGNRGDEILTEDSPPGAGFLADVCQAWEAAADPARRKGIRVVHLRTGVVLSPAGGALAKMLLPFRLGLGGRIGSGRQHMSWIALDDLLGVILHALSSESLRGPVNAASPRPVTNDEFTKTLGRVLRRPTVFPMPAFAARLAFGEVADELLLSSLRLRPARLEASGFRFLYPELEPALRHLLGK